MIRVASVAWVIAVILTAARTPAQDAAGGGTVHGKIDATTTWSGRVRVDGDVEVTSKATLEILPGTVISVASTDATAGGWNPRKIEIHVHGGLVIRGSEDSPVAFRPDAIQQRDDRRLGPATAWHGIVLWPNDGARREVHGALFSGAFSALQVPEGSVAIEDSVFLGCGVGVEAGSAFGNEDDLGLPGGEARPEIARCRFAGCFAGVYLQAPATVAVTRCVFADCRFGAGDERPGVNYAVAAPGTIADRCDFIENGVAISGSAVVANSIFYKNRLAVTASDHHRMAAAVDHFAYRHNLFYGNRDLLRGEGALGADNLHVDPQFATLIDGLGGEFPVLPSTLALGPKSPAMGAATDGGDLGAMGKAGSRRAAVKWTSADAAVRDLLVLRTEPAKDVAAPDAKSPAPVRGRPLPGQKLGTSWWVSPAVDAVGTMNLARTFGPGGRGLVVAIIESPAAGPLNLEVNGDLADCDAWWNGKFAMKLGIERRFHTQGVVIPVQAVAGPNVLTLRVAARAGQARLGIAAPGAHPASRPTGAESKPALKPLRVTSARLVKDKEGHRFIEAAVSVPLNWRDDDRQDCIRLRRRDGGAVPGGDALPITIATPQSFRAGPLPPAVTGPLTVSVAGLVDPTGSTYPADEAGCPVEGMK